MRALIVALVATAGLATLAATGASAASVTEPMGKPTPTTAMKKVQYHPVHRHYWHHGDYRYGHGSDFDASKLNQQELNSLGAAPQ
jgi:hypothetical protein